MRCQWCLRRPAAPEFPKTNLCYNCEALRQVMERRDPSSPLTETEEFTAKAAVQVDDPILDPYGVLRGQRQIEKDLGDLED